MVSQHLELLGRGLLEPTFSFIDNMKEEGGHEIL
jgi:hypothetical protein